ncbi:hypothetical protein [Dyadobacter sediminis]|uniref:hypothetical protein n=1 Tax=Dyadobacter sediminis TaxID=1493691 RepID=UPI001486F367|nr:hypothetical protein [Dyadobacter sediminis]GGC01890.1 hypothetical protein GCM10011325_31300 [Dyadobacter sediminis]
MKTNQQRWKNRVPKVEIDPSLDNYQNVVLFPEKLAQAITSLKKAKFPKSMQLRQNQD